MSTRKIVLLLVAALVIFMVCVAVVVAGVVLFLLPVRVETSGGNAPQVETLPAPVTPMDSEGNDVLATPASDRPAAGICAAAQGEILVFEVFPDMPDPRCSTAHPGQQLRVVNRTDTQIQVSIGRYRFDLQPGEGQTIESPLGEYLLPGVHYLSIAGGHAPALWLQEE